MSIDLTAFRWCPVCGAHHHPDNTRCDGLRGGHTDRDTKPPMRDYTLIGIYWDNHQPFVAHVQAEDARGAERAFLDPRGDEVAYSVLVVLDGTHTAVNNLNEVA
jgi:hypothetical protein